MINFQSKTKNENALLSLILRSIFLILFLFGLTFSLTAQPSGSWSFIGPTTILNNGNLKTNPSTGQKAPATSRVHDVAVSSDGQRVYITKHADGVWGSSDGGQNWAKLYDYAINTNSQPSIADYFGIHLQEGSDASSDVITVGLYGPGNNSGRLSYSSQVCGLAVSSDGGLNWVDKTLPDCDLVKRLHSDPNNSGKMVAHGGYSIFVYENNSWNKAPNTPFFRAIYPTSTNGVTTWYGVGRNYQANNFIYKSSDAKTWTPLQMSISELDGISGYIKARFAVKRNDSNTLFIYV